MSDLIERAAVLEKVRTEATRRRALADKMAAAGDRAGCLHHVGAGAALVEIELLLSALPAAGARATREDR